MPCSEYYNFVAARIWSGTKKILGNLIPAVFSLPFAAIGLIQFRPESPLALNPILWLAAFPVVGVIALNFTGLFGNSSMQNELGKRWGRAHGAPKGELNFIGFAHPNFKSIWDPHQEIGFLVINEDHLLIFGENEEFKIEKSSITDLRFRSNAHSWIGLGRFICIEAGPSTLYIEPRKYQSILKNKRHGATLLEQLKQWRAAS